MRNSLLYITIISLLLVACSYNSNQNRKGAAVAEVGGNYLYQSEIDRNYTLQINDTDPAEFAKKYIDKWVKQQLLLSEAKVKLTPEELDLDYEIEKYRQELLIHRYRNKRINTLNEEKIPFTDIEEYYNQNKKSFTLSHPIVRVNYFILPIEVDVPNRIKNKLHSENENDIEEYEEFMFSFATKYDNFDNSWVYLDNVLRSMNYELQNTEQYLRRNQLITFNTENEQHIIAVKEFIISGEPAPIEFVTPRIRAYMLNSKKLDFLREIKDSLYNDALKYNKFRVLNQ